MPSANKRPKSPDTTKQSLSAECSPPDNTAEPYLSPKSASNSKVVFADPGSISLVPNDKHREHEQGDTFDADKGSKHFRASIGKKRLSGRPSLERLGAVTRSSLASNPSISSVLSEDSDIPNASPKHRHAYERLSQQVTQWIQQEKVRRAKRRAKRAAAKATTQDTSIPEHAPTGHANEPYAGHGRRTSESSEGSIALDNLASILERTLSLKSNEGTSRKRRGSQGHKLSIMRRHSTVSSDTDYYEGAEDLVPACETVLDNSKTMAYTSGVPGSSEETGSTDKASRSAKKEREAWATFKYEIVRITHTLKLKGWRRVQLDRSNEIDVERLSGALTNAVYVVSPPKDVPTQAEDTAPLPAPKTPPPPPKLLLRIYGPQVEHLIDREAELQILRRLAKKRIGPRVLGTFNNGRFEEYFHAQTLTFNDLRIPETSKQIAKRMRELHEGIELLRKEREGGPFVWRNWDKWVDRCEQVVTWLDQQILESKDSGAPPEGWKQLGLICGVEWPVFRQMIEKYRAWLEDQYGGIHSVNERLVFAHNDAQYGNILRLIPSGESPLLLPANEHKQLVVIDFEYSNANLPGIEFANHFTEWCYNYHSEIPYLCTTKYYPTPEEQSRFIGAYLTHNPTFKVAGASPSNPPTPHLGPVPSSGSTTALAATVAPSSISAFMLDSRAPPGEKFSYQEQEAQAELSTEKEIKRLMAETKLWRLANSAQWTAWGIVQANIPGLPDFEKKQKEKEKDVEGEKSENKDSKASDNATLQGQGKEKSDTGEGVGDAKHGADDDDESTSHDETEHPAPDDEEFDYLAYAQERAMFVWGDAIQLGIIKAEELPEELRSRVKLVDY